MLIKKLTSLIKNFSVGFCLNARRPKSLARKPYCEIDERIKGLVGVMNDNGIITTVASCQGHGILGKPPYVYFKASIDTAASIEHVLREIAMFDDARLKTMWIVEGLFDDNYELTFLLHSPEYDKKANSLLGAAWSFWLYRVGLDKELSSLADIVYQAILANIRDKDKQQIAHSGNNHDDCKEPPKQA